MIPGDLFVGDIMLGYHQMHWDDESESQNGLHHLEDQLIASCGSPP